MYFADLRIAFMANLSELGIPKSVALDDMKTRWPPSELKVNTYQRSTMTLLSGHIQPQAVPWRCVLRNFNSSSTDLIQIRQSS